MLERVLVNGELIDRQVVRAVMSGESGGITSVSGRMLVEPLGAPLLARQVAITTTSANQALTANTTRLSIYARGADMRFAIGATAQTATLAGGNATSFFISSGERLDLDIPTAAQATPNIAAIALSGSGTLEITELS